MSQEWGPPNLPYEFPKLKDAKKTPSPDPEALPWKYNQCKSMDLQGGRSWQGWQPCTLDLEELITSPMVEIPTTCLLKTTLIICPSISTSHSLAVM